MPTISLSFSWLFSDDSPGSLLLSCIFPQDNYYVYIMYSDKLLLPIYLIRIKHKDGIFFWKRIYADNEYSGL